MTYDLASAFDKLQAHLRHNRVCPNGECLDRDDCYGLETYVRSDNPEQLEWSSDE